jgi:hypothetical protein
MRWPTWRRRTHRNSAADLAAAALADAAEQEAARQRTSRSALAGIAAPARSPGRAIRRVGLWPRNCNPRRFGSTCGCASKSLPGTCRPRRRGNCSSGSSDGPGEVMRSDEQRIPVRPPDWPAAIKPPAQFEFELLAAMAEDPVSGLTQLAPGVYKGAAECPTARGDLRRGWWSSGSC